MAKQLIYTAKTIKADEALRIGLVNAVYTQEELMVAARKIANTIDNVKALREQLFDWSGGDLVNLYKMLHNKTMLVVVSTPDLNNAYRIFKQQGVAAQAEAAS